MSDCIDFRDVFRGYLNNNGYGRVHYQKKLWLAHRLAWTLHFGPIPEGKLVLHHCDNPPCVLIEHLYIGDQFDNMRDRRERGREPAKPLACPQGHLYTPENIYIPSGRPRNRRCLTCHRQQSRDAMRRLRQERR